MKFLTPTGCDSWLADRRREKPNPANANFAERLRFPNGAGELHGLTRRIASALLPVGKQCLLWIVEWDIWDENLHLYYRLRQSYADGRLLYEAPGHLFLDYEFEDLATFLQVSMLNGWGGFLLSHMDYLNAFFSHDEYLDLFSSEESVIMDWRQAPGIDKGF